MFHISHNLATDPLSGASPLLNNLKLDQIAFASHSEGHTQNIKKALRLENARWTEDIVTATGFVAGEGDNKTNVARLLFNYDLGIEVEILQYLKGPNYLDCWSFRSGDVCHLGFHFHPGEQKADDWFERPIIQQVTTHHHTNPGVGDRRYRYTIYEPFMHNMPCMKVIERIGG